MKYAAFIVALLLLIIGSGYYVAHRAMAPGPAASSTPEVMLSADAYPLYPGLNWGAPHAATMDVFSGYAVDSAPITDIYDLTVPSQPFEHYWSQKLQGEGYSVDNMLAASGPGANNIAYKKGSEYIIVSYHTVFKGTPPNSPVQCPCDITFTVFTTASSTPAAGAAPSYLDATYTIDGVPVTLNNGEASAPAAPGSASMAETKYFGNMVTGDLNGDGVPDAAFLLTQSGGGSGTFYYVVAALKTPAGYVGTNAVLLGDRIAPQTTELRPGGELIVNYADRAAGEPMTAKPSVGVSKYLQVQNGQLVEVQH